MNAPLGRGIRVLATGQPGGQCSVGVRSVEDHLHVRWAIGRNDQGVGEQYLSELDTLPGGSPGQQHRQMVRPWHDDLAEDAVLGQQGQRRHADFALEHASADRR